MPPTAFKTNQNFVFSSMACPCEIRLAGLSPSHATALANAAIAEVQRIETKYSRYRSESVISRINAAAGSNTPFLIDAETAQLLSFAAELHRQSDGLFDATSGVLRQVWDFKAARAPSAEQIAEILPRVGWQHVEWSETHARLTRPDMELDFGGFGKEYAADRATTLLADGGARHGWVNLGGDIRVIGPQPDGAPWMMGIRHPRQDDAVIASIPISSGALATSGDYERFFVEHGERYCHILNP